MNPLQPQNSFSTNTTNTTINSSKTLVNKTSAQSINALSSIQESETDLSTQNVSKKSKSTREDLQATHCFNQIHLNTSENIVPLTYPIKEINLIKQSKNYEALFQTFSALKPDLKSNIVIGQSVIRTAAQFPAYEYSESFLLLPCQLRENPLILETFVLSDNSLKDVLGFSDFNQSALGRIPLEVFLKNFKLIKIANEKNGRIEACAISLRNLVKELDAIEWIDEARNLLNKYPAMNIKMNLTFIRAFFRKLLIREIHLCQDFHQLPQAMQANPSILEIFFENDKSLTLALKRALKIQFCAIF